MANWYVDNSVSASGTGTSWVNAWKDFSNIVWGSGGVSAGDTLYISGGAAGQSQTYNTSQLVPNVNGTAANPVTITAGVDAGHNGTVIIDGSTTTALNSNDGCVNIVNRTNLVVQNLTIQNSNESCVQVRNNTSGTVTIQHNTIHTGTGILTLTTSQATPSGNVLTFAPGSWSSQNLNNATVVDVTTPGVIPTGAPPGVSPTLITGNTATTITLSANVTGGGVKAGDTINIAFNARGIRVVGHQGATVNVQNNTVDTPANTPAQADCIYTGNNSLGSTILVQNNILICNNVDSSGHSDGIQSFNDGDSTTTLTFRGNYIAHPNGGFDNHGFIVEDIGAGANFQFYNNILVMGESFPYGLPETAIFRGCSSSSWPGNIKIWNNTIYGGYSCFTLWLPFSPPAGDQFWNNIFYARPLSQYCYLIQDNDPNSPSEYDYNCVYADNGGNRRVTNSNASSTVGMVRSTTSIASGKVHVEVQLGLQYNAGNNLIGLANSTEVLTNYVGQSANSIGYDAQNGGIYTNGTNQLTTFTSAIGDVLALEFDLTNKLFWVKNLTTNTGWNGSGTANPATGVGGVSFTAAGPYFLAHSLAAIGDYSVLNPGNVSFQGTVSSGYSAWGASTGWNSSDISANLSLTPFIANHLSTALTYATWQTDGYDVHGVNGNPLFTSPAFTMGNFQLQTGSPAIDKGTTIAAVAVDYLGVTRPQGSAYDMGAYEYVRGVLTLMQAFRLNDLLKTMGVNTHIGNTADSAQYGSGNIQTIINNINYLGVPIIRDGAFTPSLFTQVAQGTGCKMILDIGESIPNNYQSDLAGNLSVGAPYIAALEGPNEPDSSFATGLGGSVWTAAVMAPYVQAAAQNIGVPAIMNSFANIFPNPGSYGTSGNLAAYYTYGNGHTYFDPHQCGPNGDGFFSTGLIDWVNRSARLSVPSKPVAHTEFGWQTSKNASLALASYTLIFYLSAHAQWGCPFSCYYALYDDTSGPWGLFDSNANPRAHATAIRYMREILADPGPFAATFTPTNLTVTVSGLPGGENANAGGQAFLYQKSNGDYYVALWNEQRLTTEDTANPPDAPITVAPVNVTIGFPSASNVDLFDPLISVDPQASAVGVTSWVVSLPAHPVFVRIREH